MKCTYRWFRRTALSQIKKKLKCEKIQHQLCIDSDTRSLSSFKIGFSVNRKWRFSSHRGSLPLTVIEFFQRFLDVIGTSCPSLKRLKHLFMSWHSSYHFRLLLVRESLHSWELRKKLSWIWYVVMATDFHYKHDAVLVIKTK